MDKKIIFDDELARQQLLAIGSPAALALVEHAWKWGDYALMLDEAEEGSLRGPMKVANGFQRGEIGLREQTAAEAAAEEAEAVRRAKEDARVEATRGGGSGGGTSTDAGQPGNEDAAWGSSSSDGWRVD